MHCLRSLLAVAFITFADRSECQVQQEEPQKVLPTLSFEDAREEVYRTVDGIALQMWLFYPPETLIVDSSPCPAAVFFFGGGWKSGNPSQFEPHARFLASKGMIAAIADYRVESRQGTTPRECVEDGIAALTYLRREHARLGIDPNRIAAGGGSAGGHVAACTGTIQVSGKPSSFRPNALLLFNPVFDNGPNGYGHERVKGYWRSLSPLHNIRPGAPPTLVFLGDRDRLIPVTTAESYRDRMRRAGSRCDLHIYPNQGHGFFNKKRNEELYLDTLEKMEAFLISLEWLHPGQGG